MGDAPESPASICCPDPASFAGAPPMQKINLDLLPTTAEQPRGFEQRDNDFTTGSSHVFPPSLSNLFSPATPSEGSRLPRDILQYNTAVCAILVLLPVALAFGGLELVYMLDQQAESSLHSTITIQHAAPAAMREVLQPTATMDEVQPATLLQPRTAVRLSTLACMYRAGARNVRPLPPVSDDGAPHRAGPFRRLPCLGRLILTNRAGSPRGLKIQLLLTCKARRALDLRPLGTFP